MKKLRFVLCSLLAFLLIATSIPVVTEAAAKPVCQKATTLHYQYSVGTTVIMESLYIGNLSRSAKVTGIRSSNKKYKGTVRQALLQCHMDRQKRFRSSHQGWRADDHQF